MPLNKDLSIEQRDDYYTAYNEVGKLLRAAIIELEERNDVAASSEEKNENSIKILELHRSQGLVEADKVAFEGDAEEIAPPTNAQLLLLTGLIKEVDALTTQERVFEEVTRLTTDGISTWKKIHPG
jgi:hypothetical protein